MSEPSALLIDHELERLILGAVQYGGEGTFSRLTSIIGESDFAIDRHKTIWRAMAETVADGDVLDRITLFHCLMRKREGEKIGGLTYLCGLDVGLPEITNPEAYAHRLRRKSQERRTFEVFEHLSTAAAQGGVDPAAILQEGKDLIEQVAAMQTAQMAANIGECIVGFPGGLDGYLRPAKGTVGLPFPMTQRRTAGLKPGELWILGARPSMGKTAFALHLALDAAEAGHPVFLASLEMSKESIGKRLLSRMANVNLLDLIHGELNPVERSQILMALNKLRKLPLYIFDKHCKTVAQIRNQIEAGCAEGKYALAIVDYLGLLEPGRHENRNIEVTVMSRGLKTSAHELAIPVLALHQLSRGLEARADKRPELQDLRDSGSLEQDADVVLFLYREGYYKREDVSLRNACELLVRKARNGQIGAEKIEFYGQYGMFMNIEQSAQGRFSDD